MKGELLYPDSMAQQARMIFQLSYGPYSNIKPPGCAIVTNKEAFLFTDGRYFLQAEKQLDKLAAGD
jgi:hypothetical protein